jgi:hypothetical protein
MNRHKPTSKAYVTTSAAALPAEHHAAMASALAMSDSEAVREAALGFAFSPDPTVSAAALIAVSQQGHGPLVSSKVVDATASGLSVYLKPRFAHCRSAASATPIKAAAASQFPSRCEAEAFR